LCAGMVKIGGDKTRGTRHVRVDINDDKIHHMILLAQASRTASDLAIYMHLSTNYTTMA